MNQWKRRQSTEHCKSDYSKHHRAGYINCPSNTESRKNKTQQCSFLSTSFKTGSLEKEAPTEREKEHKKCYNTRRFNNGWTQFPGTDENRRASCSGFVQRGNIFFQNRNDNYTYKITGLYEGGHLLDYSFDDDMSCFTVFSTNGKPLRNMKFLCHIKTFAL